MSHYKSNIDLLIEELTEIRHLEKQFLNIIPQMLNVATDPGLRTALEANYLLLQDHILVFDKSTRALNLPSKPNPDHVIRLYMGDNLRLLNGCSKYATDAALISMALKMEHYLNAAYLNACIHARMLTLDEISDLLRSRLKSNFSLFKRSEDVVTLFMPDSAGNKAEASSVINAVMAG